MRIWNRDPSTSQTVEYVLSENEGIKLEICSEHQGEAVAIKPDMVGYYTTTELSKKNASHQFAPIYYYPIDDATRQLLNPTAQANVRDKKFNMAIIEYYTKIFRKFIFIIYTYLGLRLSDNRRFARMPAFDSNCCCSLRSLSETKHRSTRKGGWIYCKRERGRYYWKTHWTWRIGGVGGSQMKVWGQHHFTYWFVPFLTWNFITFLIGLIELN